MDNFISEELMYAYFVTRIGAMNVLVASPYVLCNSNLRPFIPFANVGYLQEAP
jgi:hypothetical protein